MPKAYVDTTILVNVLLKRGAVQQTCIAALKRYDSTELPTYALKEMKAGPLSGWIWLHNKCVACRSYAQVLAALHGMARSPRRNLPLTALEAWQEISMRNSVTLGQLVESYGRAAIEDVVKADRLRLGLRRRIMTAWRARNSTISVVHPLPCYQDAELGFANSGVINCRPVECHPTPNCSLATQMAKDPDKVRLLHAAVEKSPPKAENARRLKALRHILRTPKRPLDDGMCRALGDAIFAFFAPSNSVILTTNIGDHKVLAEALGKSAETP